MYKSPRITNSVSEDKPEITTRFRNWIDIAAYISIFELSLMPDGQNHATLQHGIATETPDKYQNDRSNLDPYLTVSSFIGYMMLCCSVNSLRPSDADTRH